MWSQVPEIKITQEKPRKKLNYLSDFKTQSSSDSLFKLRPPEIDLDWDEFSKGCFKKSASNSPAFPRSPKGRNSPRFPTSPSYPRSPLSKSPCPSRIKTFKTNQVCLDHSPQLAPISEKISQLSITQSFIHEETEETDLRSVNEYLKSVKDHLGDIRKEAKLTFKETKEIVKGNKKKATQGGNCEGIKEMSESSQEAKKSILKMLKDNLQKLNNRVNFWEEQSEKQAQESGFIMSKSSLLSDKVTKRECTEGKQVNSEKCLSSCLIF